jgi:hypothetical protein
MRFQFLKAAGVKMVAFWVFTPCSLVEVTNSAGVFAASIIRVEEAASTSGTSVEFFYTSQGNDPEDSHLEMIVSPRTVATRLATPY